MKPESTACGMKPATQPVTRRHKEFIPDCKDCRKDAWAQVMFIMRKARRAAHIAATRNHYRLGHVNEFENCGFYECECIRLKLSKIGDELKRAA